MNKPVKVLLIVIAIAVVIVVLFTTVFPWVERTLEQDPTLGDDPAAAPEVLPSS